MNFISCLTNAVKEIKIVCFILLDTPFDIITGKQSIIENNLAMRFPEHFFSRTHLKGPGSLCPNERKAIYERLFLTDDTSSHSNGEVDRPPVPDETQSDTLRSPLIGEKRPDRTRPSSKET